MSDLSAHIRDIAESLLDEGKVDVVIGYEWGSLPLVARPCFVRSADEVDQLIWNACCTNSLSPYLLVTEERVGICVKGCDARAAVAMILERQIPRENVVIVAIPCEGVIDRKKLGRAADGKEILEGSLEGETVVMQAGGLEKRIALADLVAETCQTCPYPTPPVYDIMVGDPIAAKEGGDRFRAVERMENLSVEERWAYFEQEFQRCIRCYACRQTCPLCYCQVCFIDQTQPAWLGRTDDLSDTMLFHVVRAMHLAGRCVECGACASVCPMGIDLMALNRKLIKDIKEWYDFESGLEEDTAPPLSSFRLSDPEESLTI